jgi:uncharacterized protein (DUF1684 family)
MKRPLSCIQGSGFRFFKSWQSFSFEIKTLKMNKKLLITIAVLGIVIIMVYNFLGTGSTSEGYLDEISAFRTEKDEMFKNSGDSPLTETQLTAFQKLNYFPINERYRIEAEFKLNTLEQTIEMAITDGSQRTYLIYGNAHFHLDGKELDLTVYKAADETSDYLFVPFYDNTSADVTYGGGRYLEPELLDNSTLEIDFNMAYNPYCAYNPTYRCPIPPRENSLDVSILAGEKIPDFVH